MQNTSKNRAPAPKYVSAKQLSFTEFESPFERKLNPLNRWIILSKLLPWDELCSIYWKDVPEKGTGRLALKNCFRSYHYQAFMRFRR